MNVLDLVLKINYYVCFIFTVVFLGVVYGLVYCIESLKGIVEISFCG